MTSVNYSVYKILSAFHLVKTAQCLRFSSKNRPYALNCSHHLEHLCVFLQPVTWWTKASWLLWAPLAAHQRDPCSRWQMPCTSLTSSSSARRQEHQGAAAGSPGATVMMTTRYLSALLSTWMMSSWGWSQNMPGRNSSFFMIMTMVSITRAISVKSIIPQKAVTLHLCLLLECFASTHLWFSQHFTLPQRNLFLKSISVYTFIWWLLC